MEKYSVAIFGKGYWGKVLEKYFSAHDGFSIWSIYDSKCNIKEVMKAPFDVAVIATPDDTHGKLVKLAVENDKKVFCEKPYVTDFKELTSIDRKFKKEKHLIYVDYPYLESIGVDYFFNLLKKEIFGKVLTIELTSEQYGPNAKKNVYWVLGSHMLSLASKMVDLSGIVLKTTDRIIKDKKIVGATMNFNKDNIKFFIDINLDAIRKNRHIIAYCENGIVKLNLITGEIAGRLFKKLYRGPTFNESNNIELVVNRFYNNLIYSKSNLDLAITISILLMGIDISEKYK